MSDTDPSQAPHSHDWGAWPDLPTPPPGRRRSSSANLSPRSSTPEDTWPSGPSSDDSPRGRKPSRRKRSSGRLPGGDPSDGRPLGGEPSSGKLPGTEPAGRRPSGERLSGGEPSGGLPGSGPPGGKLTGSELSGGKMPGAALSSGKPSGGEPSAGWPSLSEWRQRSRPSAEPPSADSSPAQPAHAPAEPSSGLGAASIAESSGDSGSGQNTERLSTAPQETVWRPAQDNSPPAAGNASPRGQDVPPPAQGNSLSTTGRASPRGDDVSPPAQGNSLSTAGNASPGGQDVPPPAQGTSSSTADNPSPRGDVPFSQDGLSSGAGTDSGQFEGGSYTGGQAEDDPYQGGRRGERRSGRGRRSGGRGGKGARSAGSRGRGGWLPDGPDEGSAAGAAPHADPESVARAICLRLLTMAPKTRAQLAEALRKRDVPDEAAETVLDRFSELGLINDEAFAEAWVDSRHHGRGLAKRALAAELRHRGVDSETVNEAVDRLEPDQELETARRLVERKLSSTRGLDPQVRTRRLAGMLARKGYAPGLAFRVIREALETEGVEIEDDFS
ncbi:recombination regulator RecX [Nonomuraea sp. NPDC049158]|uniref:recombination regulator RecX n=1 Tax=Nonomuraea sp. NPDC049158 TaxID=3155649 RepID=UPI0033EC0F12